MKRTIRYGVWESNSSNTHSLIIATEEEFTKWLAGELILDTLAEKLIPQEPSEDSHWYHKTYEEYKYDSDDFGLDKYEEWYTSPSGDKLVIFGKYGRDS